MNFTNEIEEIARNTDGGLTEAKKRILKESFEREYKFWEAEAVREDNNNTRY